MTGEDLLGRLVCMTEKQRKYPVTIKTKEWRLAPISTHNIIDPDYSPSGNQNPAIVLEAEWGEEK